MKMMRTEDAVGSVLCHDITKIVPGEFKGVLFKKGHIVRAEDVPELLKVGKEHLYVWEQREGFLHENDAAVRLAQAVAGPNIKFGDVHEGRVNLQAAVGGLLKVDRKIVNEVNSLEQIVLATRHANSLVQEGDVLAGTRVVPLVIDEERVRAVEEICRGRSVLEVKPLRRLKVGLVITGSEVYHGRIQDAFGPVLVNKFEALGSEVAGKVYVPDDLEQIAAEVKSWLEQGVDMIAVSGGMSVDPDDLTPGAIKAAGAELIGYGAPVLPGSMFLLGYFGSVPVVGLPGCVMYSKATVLDLVLPRILAGERISRQDFVELGYGGLCLGCAECKFPVCPFGKA